MDISKIKDVAKNRGFQWKTVAEYVGLTPHGLSLSCERGTLTVANLVKISNFLGMNPADWFEAGTIRAENQDENYAADRERGVILLEIERVKSEVEKLKKEVSEVRQALKSNK